MFSTYSLIVPLGNEPKVKKVSTETDDKLPGRGGGGRVKDTLIADRTDFRWIHRVANGTCFTWTRKNGLYLERERLLFPCGRSTSVDLCPGIIDHGRRASACVRAMWYFVPLSRWFVVCTPARHAGWPSERWESIISPFAERTAHVSRLYMTYGVYLPSRFAAS